MKIGLSTIIVFLNTPILWATAYAGDSVRVDLDVILDAKISDAVNITAKLHLKFKEWNSNNVDRF
jgi:hypothetical protein